MNFNARFPRAMQRILPLLLLSLFAGSAQAEWLAIGRNENFRVYLEQQSLERNGEFVLTIQLMDFVTAQWVDAQTVVSSIITRVEYDCTQPRLRTLFLEAFTEQMGAGRRLSAEKIPNPEWEAVKPGSNNENIQKMVCKK